MITPNNITRLKDNEIFVFGSNYSGRHGKGAALTAYRKFGAKLGQGSGLQGRSYGICTKDHRLKTLSLDAIQSQVSKFLKFAEQHHELAFLVTEIGCGLAGYKPKDIAPLFFINDKISANIILPESFWKIINKEI